MVEVVIADQAALLLAAKLALFLFVELHARLQQLCEPIHIARDSRGREVVDWRQTPAFAADRSDITPITNGICTFFCAPYSSSSYLICTRGTRFRAMNF